MVSDVAVTPAWTRYTRMIRDGLSHDIMAGIQKQKWRQPVEKCLCEQRETKGIQVMRLCEVGTACDELSAL